jgi:hypothetical protein
VSHKGAGSSVKFPFRIGLIVHDSMANPGQMLQGRETRGDYGLLIVGACRPRLKVSRTAINYLLGIMPQFEWTFRRKQDPLRCGNSLIEGCIAIGESVPTGYL